MSVSEALQVTSLEGLVWVKYNISLQWIVIIYGWHLIHGHFPYELSKEISRVKVCFYFNRSFS